MASLYADAAAVSDERFPMDVLQHISVLVINIAPEGVVGYGLVGTEDTHMTEDTEDTHSVSSTHIHKWKKRRCTAAAITVLRGAVSFVILWLDSIITRVADVCHAVFCTELGELSIKAYDIQIYIT